MRFLEGILLSMVVMIIYNPDATLFAADNVAASNKPPKGLDPKKVPQFVNIGFDDNNSPGDGMEWELNLFRSLKNPAGTGNKATFDGSAARCVFYMTTSYGSDMKNTWIKAYQDGHEIGNHTTNHPEYPSESSITSATNWLVSNLGIPKSEIWGFRTPYLAYNASTFVNIKNAGLIYDCSLHGGSTSGDGTAFNWPYTLDNGSPGENIGKVAGLWEVPDHYVIMTNGTRITGLDWNLWVEKFMSGDQFAATLKHTFDLRYNGNRAPMCFGAHSYFYSPKDPGADPEVNNKTNCAQRQAALKAFVEYVLDPVKFPDVRFVTSKDIIQWMRNPVALDGTPVVRHSESMLPGMDIAGTRNGVQLTVEHEGLYTVRVFSIDGKKIAQRDNLRLHAGMNTVALHDIHAGVECSIVEVEGNGVKRVERVTTVAPSALNSR